MILLDEAVERFNRAGAPYGVRVAPWRRRAKFRQHLEEIEADLGHLSLPAELWAFWMRWDPASVLWPTFDGLIPLHQIVERREIEYPPCPAVLIPIADWTHARIWVELASDDHPGGRVFHSYHDESEVSLLSFGISGLLDLLSTTFERDLVDDRTGSLHDRHFFAVVKRSLDDLIGPSADRRFEGIDRTQFAPHWLHAEGLSSEHFALRGADHTVQSFRLQREASPQLTATLVGTYETSVGGGPLQGCVGTFTDETGSLQVFVPQMTGLAGAIGDGGAVEVDLLAVAPNGADLNSLSAKSDMQRAAGVGLYDYNNDLIIRLFEQMKYLDTSIVVTGLRPIR
jgi:hypothetical protein